MNSIDQIVYVHNIFLSLYWGRADVHNVIFSTEMYERCEWAGVQREIILYYTHSIDQIGYIHSMFFILAFWYISYFDMYAFMQKVRP